MLRYQLPLWPERLLTRAQRQPRSSVSSAAVAGAKWVASEDFSQTIGYLRTAIQIPGAAHCALEYQRWAVRSQLRGEGRRFMKSMIRPLGVPLLHMRGDADPYVLADPVDAQSALRAARTLRIHRRRRALQPRREARRKSTDT